MSNYLFLCKFFGYVLNNDSAHKKRYLLMINNLKQYYKVQYIKIVSQTQQQQQLIIQLNMAQIQSHQQVRYSDQQMSDVKFQTTFYYQIANLKAMKIIVLIKTSKLNYCLEETVSDELYPFYLKTEKGELKKEYEIINYIVNQSKQLGKSEFAIKIYDNLKDSVLSHDSQVQPENNQDKSQVVNLGGQDIFLHSRMTEVLFQLRCNLFPLLDEFYKYLLGHQKIRKVKYDSLINKIKKQIGKLDANMNEHSDLYAQETNFLNIVIACQLFIGSKFVFEEKFRKSKYSLFTKYQKISKRPQFEEIFGKTTLCLKEYVPPEFQSDQPEGQNKKTDQYIPQQIVKLSESVLNLPNVYDSDRNQLLYNYFRSVFTQHNQKKGYFPYFWLMFDTLNCNLIQILHPTKGESLDQLTKMLKIFQFQLQKYLKTSSVDYGLIGIYQNQSDKTYLVRGVLCLGSKSVQDFTHDMEGSVQLRGWSIKQIDIQESSQKQQVQNLWDNVIQNNVYEGVVTCSVIYI